jgi:hypothetical protein
MITDPAQGYNIKNKKSKNRDIILDKATRKTAPHPNITRARHCLTLWAKMISLFSILLLRRLFVTLKIGFENLPLDSESV